MKRRFNLEAHKVARVVQPTPTLIVACIGPVGANDGEHDSGETDRAMNGVGEVRAGNDRVVVSKYALWAEVLLQPVCEPTGGAQAVLSAVREKDI
jgi:hypothetical protein